MELKGIISAVLDRKSGTSARGNWMKQDFVLEIPGQYPRHLCFTVFGEEKLKSFDLHKGDAVLVKFDVDSHEYNGKWYNDITAYNVTKEGTQQPVQQPTPRSAQPQSSNQPQQTASAPVDAFAQPENNGQDNLPF